MRERRDRLPRELELGSTLRTRGGEGAGHPPAFRVTELSASEATLDGNHPFAGHTVEMRCAVLDVRPATEDEIGHGHAHGPDEDHAH
ncbi:MAG: hypothetical protein E6H77_14590 [Betaproteobacteria bacterium]|nr:MAG: hypothetical protein E6H77_14590 [Betaproteobacteria bacterium]